MAIYNINWHRFWPASPHNYRKYGGGRAQYILEQNEQGPDHPCFIYNLDKTKPFPREFAVSGIVTNKFSKAVDFLPVGVLSGGNFVTSKRCKHLLDEFNLPEHQEYAVEATVNGIKYDYYIYHFYISNYEAIDFESTKFEIWKQGEQINEFVSFVDYNEFATQTGIDIKTIRANPISFLDEYNQYDMIFIDRIFNGLFISTRLKDKLIENKISTFSILSETFFYPDGIHPYKNY